MMKVTKEPKADLTHWFEAHRTSTTLRFNLGMRLDEVGGLKVRAACGAAQRRRVKCGLQVDP